MERTLEGDREELGCMIGWPWTRNLSQGRWKKRKRLLFKASMGSRWGKESGVSYKKQIANKIWKPDVVLCFNKFLNAESAWYTGKSPSFDANSAYQSCKFLRQVMKPIWPSVSSSI